MVNVWLANAQNAPIYEGLTKEMAEYVQEYVDYVRDQLGQLYVETRVHFDEWVPEGFGTCDAAVVSDDLCTIVDLKYGKGVPVYAENNPQGMLYALGIYSEFGLLHDIQRFKIVIHQPRLDNVSEWEISVDDLLEWGQWVSGKAKEALEPNAKRVPGTKQCQFCKAKAKCRPHLEATLDAITEGFDDDLDNITLKDPNELSIEDLAKVLPHIDSARTLFAALEARAAQTIENGEEVPGYKLVAGRSIRRWKDEDAASRTLVRMLGKKDAYTSKLISPTQAEKLVDKAKRGRFMSRYVVKPEGRPTLVPQDNPKPALVFDPGAGFDNHT